MFYHFLIISVCRAQFVTFNLCEAVYFDKENIYSTREGQGKVEKETH